MKKLGKKKKAITLLSSVILILASFFTIRGIVKKEAIAVDCSVITDPIKRAQCETVRQKEQKQKQEYAKYGGNTEVSDTAAASDGGYNTTPCKDESPMCYSLAKHGAFWIKIAADSDSIPLSSIGIVSAFSTSPIVGCATRGGAAYVLVTRYYTRDGAPTNSLAGPVALSNAWGRFQPDSDPRFVAPETAEAAFNKYAAEYAALGKFYTSTSQLGWFCAELDGEGSPPPEDETFETCDDIMIGNSLRGTTISRIAVINKTLDYGNVKNPGFVSHLNPNNYRWETVRGPREPLTTEVTGSGGGDAWTLGKPGDSVQFLHCISFGVRYVRVAVTEANKDKWVSQSSHSSKPDGQGGRLKLPDQSFEAGSSRGEKYLFGNQLDVVNGKLANVKEFDKGKILNGIVSNTKDGLYVNDDKATVAFLSSSPETNLNCIRYPTPYYKGTFQIPGFTLGQECNASLQTGNGTEVGEKKGIQQQHDFRSLDLYEQYYHKGDYSCGCENDESSWDDNHSDGDLGKGFGEDRSGHRQIRFLCVDDGECECQYSEPIYDGPGPDDWHREKCCCKQDYALNSSNYRYNHILKDNDTPRKTAEVYVPYNFTTSVSSYFVDVGDVIFQGTKITPSFTWSVDARANEYTSDTPYATHTPSWTIVRRIEFLADGSFDTSGNDRSTVDPCAYFGGEQCRTIDGVDITGAQNPYGDLMGSNDGSNPTRSVPDDGDYVGKKYCVAVGIYPSDSHNFVDGTVFDQKRDGKGPATPMDAGDYWNISGASCRTIAKKPNFQVWNGSVYTEGKVYTSLTKKKLDIPFGHKYEEGGEKLFGSWTDYALVSGGTESNVYGMASGAKLGYENSSYSFGLPGGADGNATHQQLSPMTISNNEEQVGKSNISAMTSISLNMERLKARYKDKAKQYSKELGISGSNMKKIYAVETGMQFVYDNSGFVSLSELTEEVYSEGKNKILAGNTLSIDSNGLYKGTCTDGNKPCDDTDNTLVINVEGILYIDKNICLTNNINQCSSDSTTLSSYSSIKTTSPSSLPQIIIFAENIVVSENVSRIDAWLISEGSLDTCGEFENGVTNHRQCNHTLVVNGPVYTDYLFLNRTAGASYGSGQGCSDVLNCHLGSITSGSVGPAEIFNLRADIYIWAYNQAQRYSEAVVTYTRELAPRY